MWASASAEPYKGHGVQMSSSHEINSFLIGFTGNKYPIAATENHGVGGSIPSLGTTPQAPEKTTKNPPRQTLK